MRRKAFAPGLAFLILSIAITPALASPTFTTLHAFNNVDGSFPSALTQASDGLLYGGSQGGGTNGDGAIFTIDTAGNNFADLFSLSGSNGNNPDSPTIEGSDGYLYGTTFMGGAHGTNNDGVVYKVKKDGTGYTDLYDFGANATDGFLPLGVIQGSDGNLYGVTQDGGANGGGTVYQLSTTGGTPTYLYSFGANASDLLLPQSLIECENGSLFGETMRGGANNTGGIFRINLDGTGYAILYSFPSGVLGGVLIQGGDGFLYGTTLNGGAHNHGTVFKIAPDGTGFQTINSFAGGVTDGSSPGGLVLASNGNLYGATLQGGANSQGTLYQLATDGSTYSVLYMLGGSDGFGPNSLTQATNGVFYGVTLNPFFQAPLGQRYGTIFSLDNSLPASPTGLHALGSDAQVQVFWNTDADPNVDPNAGYNLYRSTTSGGEGNTPYQTNLPTPNFFDNNVTNGTQYFYQVTAIKLDATETAKSYEVTGTPQMDFAAVNGLTASPNPVTASKSTTGTVTLNIATAGPTTAFLSSSDPSVTFTSPDVTVPAGQPSTTFTINTANTGAPVSATITASQNSVDTSTTLTVNVPNVLHTFQSGLQMISANTDDTGITLANDFGQQGSPSPALAVWTGSAYAVSPIAPANAIVPGQGYWFHPASTANLYDIGTDQANNASVNVSLAQGWNMIGNPYGSSISGPGLLVQSGLNNITLSSANLAGLIGATLYTWQPGDSAYETQSVSSATLAPYEGYWVYAFQPCTLVLQDLQ
jgi:uncharacterized repeat protein (TIGR03803 family)